MPTYLLHGFRWRRDAIRIHIILNDLEDAAAEWILAPATSMTLLNSFYANYDFLPPSTPPQTKYDIPIPPIPTEEKTRGPRTLKKAHKSSMRSLRGFGGSLGRKSRPPNLKEGNGNEKVDGTQRPHTAHAPSSSTSTSSFHGPKKFKAPSFNDWSVVKLLEQYDPNDMSAASQPYAYVADYMVEITLSASLKEEMAKYEDRDKEADWPLSMPTSPASPGMSDTGSIVGSPGSAPSEGLTSVGMSARDIRRKSRRLGWFEKLRDGLQKGEDIGWYVVYCGDEERASPNMDMHRVPSRETRSDYSPQRTPRSAILRGFFRSSRNTVE